MASFSSIPLLDLKPQYELLREELDTAMLRVAESQQYILGPDVRAFEEEVASYLGVKYALGVSSGTDALLMALMALEVVPGDEVITTPYSFFATAGSIARLGLVPRFVDIDPLTFNIDPNKIEEVINSRTRAIMPVHLFGQSAEMDIINEIACRHNLPVIEDTAQAIGSKYNGRMVGSIGTIGCFSFFPSKNLGCFGDGGLVSTDSFELYEKLLSIRNHGQTPAERYKHIRLGGNFRIDTLQSAILRVKLPHLDSWLQGRRKNANIYGELFKEHLPEDVFSRGDLVLPQEKSPAYHTFNQFVTRIPFRDRFVEAAGKSGVGVMVYYPYPLHTQPCFSSLGYVEGDFPQSEKAAKETVALPIYPEAPTSHLRKVVELMVETGREEGVW
ncbi:MAG TPA: DegT/DnrJ/EryC1/StrS family aminotransferase [Oligoflexia bacterium]|nr:DegT/DnrJ/EryC1/StrS family aminotransferase [Oligoflexia bacterium]HMP47606.1 DegT/DnrJ/EryC1/StrS family aminotransferase [Oligoflexia bacterium]